MSTDSQSTPDNDLGIANVPSETEADHATDSESAVAEHATRPQAAASHWLQRLPRWLWPWLRPVVTVAPSTAETPPPQAPRRWHFKTGALLGLLFGVLCLGSLGGALYSYQLFAEALGKQGIRLDAQDKLMKKLTLEAKQQTRMANERQEALQQTQGQLETIRAQLNRTTAAMRAQAADLAKQQKESRARGGSSAGASSANANEQFSGNCSIDASAPAESLSRCLQGLPQ